MSVLEQQEAKMAEHQYYHILYPEDRLVSDDQIESWFMDALADNEIGPDYRDARTPDEMAEALEDMGFISLAREGA
jgi:hypothetical protein